MTVTKSRMRKYFIAGDFCNRGLRFETELVDIWFENEEKVAF